MVNCPKAVEFSQIESIAAQHRLCFNVISTLHQHISSRSLLAVRWVLTGERNIFFLETFLSTTTTKSLKIGHLYPAFYEYWYLETYKKVKTI